MMKQIDFESLDEIEKRFYLEETWCDSCGKADLGIENIGIFVEGSKKVVVGNCRVCGSDCRSEIVSVEVKE